MRKITTETAHNDARERPGPVQDTAKNSDFTKKIHTEKAIDGFTALDGTVRFYSFVKAVALRARASAVLDFGAGHGAAALEDTSLYRRHLRDLRANGAHVTACDVDDAVLGHATSDAQVVIVANMRLPFDDESFDVIVSDMTFEHIEDASFVARELARILRPGGYICARTPNRFGYVRLASSIVPNSRHAAILRYVQPHRRSADVFPTFYRMNSPGQIRRLFEDCSVYHYFDSAEPAYYFGNPLLYHLLLFVHRLLPPRMRTSLCVFIRKPA